jgi:hypothetical protein
MSLGRKPAEGKQHLAGALYRALAHTPGSIFSPDTHRLRNNAPAPYKTATETPQTGSIHLYDGDT